MKQYNQEYFDKIEQKRNEFNLKLNKSNNYYVSDEIELEVGDWFINSTDDSGDDEKHAGTAAINAVSVKNDGYVSALAIFGYTRYTAETTEGNTEYVHYLLAPDEEIIIPASELVCSRSFISFSTCL